MDLFNVVIEDETDDKKLKAKIDQYNPRNWDLGETPVRSNCNGPYRRGTAMLRLLVLWKSACESCIDLLQTHFGSAPDAIKWGVGWVFSDTVGARHLGRDNTHYMLLNPCTDEGKMRYSLADKEDLVKIAFLAGHEIVHIIYGDHDEDFASAYTEMAQHIGFHLALIIHRMKAAKEMSLAQLKGQTV